jgi:hypothetical protein
MYSLLLGTYPLDGLGCPGVTKVVIDIRKFVFPSPLWEFDSETELDLGNYSKRIRVERDLSLCELLNGDVGILYGWPNVRNKSCVFVPTHFDLPIALLKFILT